MRIYLRLLTGFIFLSLLTTAVSSFAKPLFEAFYYPGERHLKQLDLDLNLNTLKHLDVLIYSPSTDGLKLIGSSYRFSTLTKDNLALIARYLRQHHLHTRLLVSLGVWHPHSMREVIINPQQRQRFINSVILTLRNKRYHLSGVDIDWENEYSPIAHELQRFPNFIRDLEMALQHHRLGGDLLTVDIPTNFADKFPDPRKWIPYVSWANFMAYDYYGDQLPYTELESAFGKNTTPYPNNIKPNYQTYALVTALQTYHQRGIKNSKMVVILPIYGVLNYVQHTTAAYYYGLRRHTLGNGDVIPIPYWKLYIDCGIYGHTKNGYQAHKYTFMTPPRASGYNAFWLTKGTHFISYPDPIATRQIARYVASHRYHGLAAWELSDTIKFNDPNSLMRIMYDALQT